MERATINEIKTIFGNNFIGIDELKPLFSVMGFSCRDIKVPEINYPIELLKQCAKSYILVFGVSDIDGVNLSISTFRNIFGIDPDISEPCFYNQDWYLMEDFFFKTLEGRWYLLKRDVLGNSRAVLPELLLDKGISFPSAVLCVYTFFAYYYINNEMLWYHDFIWCNDTDHNGDRIYVGKYHDVDGVNKNGFSIHRHLALRNCYGCVDLF